MIVSQPSLLILAASLCYHGASAAGHVNIKRTPKDYEGTVSLQFPRFFHQYGAQRVKISYEPQTVPPMTENDGMMEWIIHQAPKPCEDCLIIFMQSDLEYVDGTPANADTGMWLHHTVSTCTNKIQLTCPHAEVGDMFFASGNERAPWDLTANGTQKVGYSMRAGDNLAILTELMNMSPVAQTAVLSTTYEYVPGIPEGFEVGLPLWLDVAGCSADREVMPTAQMGAFEFVSQPWVSDRRYRIVGNMGHLHDGGVRQETFRNNEPICDIKPRYGETPAYISTDMMMMDHSSHGGTPHISSMDQCPPDEGWIERGDRMTIRSTYNVTEREAMRDMDGLLAPVMGMSWLLLIAEDRPIGDRLRGSAFGLAVAAHRNRTSFASGFVFLSAFGFFAFWIGRRSRARMLERDSYGLETMRNDYID